MTRYRITIRDKDVELRGYIDSMNRVREFAQALESTGAIVVASISPDGSQQFSDDIAERLAQLPNRAGHE